MKWKLLENFQKLNQSKQTNIKKSLDFHKSFGLLTGWPY